MSLKKKREIDLSEYKKSVNYIMEEKIIPKDGYDL
jgi:hypothetical protein